MTTDCVGGVWQYAVELTRQLDRLGHDVVLASMGGTLTEAHRREVRGLRRAVLHESQLRLEWMSDAWEDVETAGEWLDALLQEHDCELLHFNCFGPAARPWSVPTLLVLHSCVDSWWRATHGTEPGEEWDAYHECVAHALDYSSHVAAPTLAALADMIACYPEAAFRARASVVYNGIETNDWPVGLSTTRNFVLGAGRVWDEGKNLAALMHAADDLPCPVLIAGACAGERAGESKAIMLKHVARARLASYYRRALVFAHPAHYEPCGLAVLEAALSGCALVLGDIPTLRELWGPVAVFVDPDDTAALRAAIARLAAAPEQAAEMGRRARRHALRYSGRTMALSYLSIYESLLSHPRRQGAA